MFRRTLVLVIFGLVASCSAPGPALLTDQQVIELFTTHRSVFVRLVDMATTEPRIGSVDIEEGGTYRVSPGGVPKSKVDQVVTHARELGVHYIGVPPPDGQGRYVQFGVSTRGISLAGTAKSLVYSEGPMAGEAVGNTDDLKPSDGMQIVYRKIADNWYIKTVAN